MWVFVDKLDIDEGASGKDKADGMCLEICAKEKHHWLKENLQQKQEKKESWHC